MSDTAEAPAQGFDTEEARGFMREITTQKRVCDEENGKLRRIYARAKNAGHDVDAMRAALKDANKDQREVSASLANRLKYLALRSIVITPTDLFGGMDVQQQPRREDDAWDAEDKGYRAGRQGMSIDDCPYQAGSENFVIWRDHWHKGQASIAREMGPNTETAAPARKRRASAQEQAATSMGEVDEAQNEAPPMRKTSAGNGNGGAKKSAAKKSGARAPARRKAAAAPTLAAQDGVTIN